MGRLFISHSSHDNAVALAILNWLNEQGWNDVFLDIDPKDGILPGTRWQDELRRANTRCEAVLLLVSPNWLASSWCQAEYLLASQMNKHIVCAVIETMPLEELPGTLTAEWQTLDLTQPERDYCLPNSEVQLSSQGLSRLGAGLRAAGVAPNYFPWPPKNQDAPVPYPGLSAFSEEDVGIFFGRDGQILRALDQIRSLREQVGRGAFTILGASGAGKSSFLRAGILPRLKRDTQSYSVLPTLRPRRAALTGDEGMVSALQKAFADVGRHLTRSEVLNRLTTDPVYLFGDLTDTTLILPIDQAEEFLDQKEGNDALRIIASLDADERSRVISISTIRSDRWESLQSHPAFDETQHTLFSLPPMPQGAYSEVINGPAARMTEAGWPLAVEAGLVEHLLVDIAEGHARDALPILAFTLRGLWHEEGSTGKLRLSTYQAEGGLQDAIERAVERVFARADEDRRIPLDEKARITLLRRGFIPWLAGIDYETGVPRRRVARFSEIPEEARPLMEILIEERLLTSDLDAETGEKTLEPAHEALLRQWTLVDDWLGEDLQDLTAIEGVRRAARDWAANGRDPAWLVHGGARLEVALSAIARKEFSSILEATDHSYLADAQAAADAAKQRVKRRKRAWWGVAGASVAGLAAFAIVVFALWVRTDAARLNAEASLRLVAAGDLTAAGLPERAAQEALGAFNLTENKDTRSGLWAAAAALPDRLEWAMELPEVDKPLSLAWHPDGRMVLGFRDGRVSILSEDGTAEDVDLAPTDPPYDGSQVRLLSLKATHDGVIATFGDGTVRAMDASNEVQTIAVGTGQAMSGANGAHAVSDNGRASAFLTNGTVFFRRCEEPTCADYTLELDQPAIASSPNDVRLAMGTRDDLFVLTQANSVRLFQMRDRGEPEQVHEFSGTAFLGFNRAGKVVLSTDPERSGDVDEPTTEFAELVLWEEQDVPVAPVLSPDAELLASLCGVATVCVHPISEKDLFGGGTIRLYAGSAELVDYVWSPKGERLATVDLEGTLRVWRIEPGNTDQVTKLESLSRDPETGHLVAMTNGARFIIGEDGSLLLMDRFEVQKESPSSAFPFLPPTHSMAVKLISYLLSDKTIIDGATGAEEQFSASDWQAVSDVIKLSDGAILAFPFRQNAIVYLRPARGGNAYERSQVINLPARPTGAAFDADDLVAFVSTVDGALRRIDFSLGKELEPVHAGTAQSGEIGATSVSLTRDGSLVVASLGELELAVYSTEDGAIIHRIPLAYPDTKVVDFDPEGRRLALLASNGVLEIWSLAAEVPGLYAWVDLSDGITRPSDMLWLAPDRLAIATASGTLRFLSLSPSDWGARVLGVLREPRVEKDRGAP